MKPKIIRFGANGWQAIIGDDFTFDNVRLVTYAICNYLRRQQSSQDNFPPRLAIGYDNRFMGIRFAEMVADVVTQNGFDVFLSTVPTPTPVVSWAIQDLIVTGAIVITGSDTHPEYNGMKFITSHTATAEVEATGQVEEELDKIMENGGDVPLLPINPGEIEDFDPRIAYFSHLTQLIDLQKIVGSRIDITADYLNGVSSGYFKEILSRANGVVREIHCSNSSDFEGIIPNLSNDNLKELQQVVLTPRGNLQIGIAIDGDGSNIKLVDASGIIVEHDQLFALLTRHLLENKKMTGGIVKPESLGDFTEDIANKVGMPVYKTKNIDFRKIGMELQKNRAMLGSDCLGGYIFKNHILERDGILAGLFVLEMMATYKQNINNLLEMVETQDIKIG